MLELSVNPSSQSESEEDAYKDDLSCSSESTENSEIQSFLENLDYCEEYQYENTDISDKTECIMECFEDVLENPITL